jgi:hypothetical protein
MDTDVVATLISAVDEKMDEIAHPRVFRLFMPRREPRNVVGVAEIEEVERNANGIVRWNEGPYPPRSEPLRKGGNAFVRGDIDLRLHDAWWMGREQTDLRLLLMSGNEAEVLFRAWWSRAGTGGLRSRWETDGDVWPVRLIV